MKKEKNKFNSNFKSSREYFKSRNSRDYFKNNISTTNSICKTSSNRYINNSNRYTNNSSIYIKNNVWCLSNFLNLRYNLSITTEGNSSHFKEAKLTNKYTELRTKETLITKEIIMILILDKEGIHAENNLIIINE